MKLFGLLISCATPEARVPMEVILFAWMSFDWMYLASSSILRNSVMSFTVHSTIALCLSVMT